MINKTKTHKEALKQRLPILLMLIILHIPLYLVGFHGEFFPMIHAILSGALICNIVLVFMKEGQEW